MSNNNDDEQDLYDEFGNYIGPDLDEDSDDDDDDDDSNDDEQPRQQQQQQRQPHQGDDQADSDVSDDEGDDQNQNRHLIPHDPSSAAAVAASMLAEPMQAIVLHEDKEYYPSVDQVYGEDVRTAVLEEDAMELEEPIVKPVFTKTPYATATPDATTTGGGGVRPLHVVDEQTGWNYSSDYLTAMLSNETTRTRRGVAIVGHLHHGKTTLMDVLLESTLRDKKNGWGTVGATPHRNKEEDEEAGVRYTDTLKTERERHMSLSSTPMTTLLCDTRGKHYGITLMDCPGHVNFHDESVAALRAMDGAVIVVDAVEGIMIHTEMVVRQAIAEGLPLVLVISKMDRLIVELKLPPRDCYYKLLHLIDSINELIGKASNGRYNEQNRLLLSPARGNVAFSSALHGWLFTLPSFAQVYLDHMPEGGGGSGGGLGDNLSAAEFAKRLWGYSYLDPATRTFQTSPRDCALQSNGTAVERTFCQFVLEPLYKIYTACLGEREAHVNPLLRSLGVLLSKDELRASARPLLRTALSRFLGRATCGFVDMLVQHIPCPAAAARGKVARCYSGPLDSKIAKAMLECNPRGPLMMHAVKLYSSPDGRSFWTLGRIYSGTVRPGEQVQVLGEGYSPDDEEDMTTATVEGIAIPRGPTRLNVSMAKAGNWVLLEGVDATIAKTATIVKTSERNSSSNNDNDQDVCIFSPLQFPQAGGEAIVKLAMEPLIPSDLPKMVEGLRRISKAYPMVKTRVEESGEHVLFGTGELYLDCVMHDLRHVYSDIEIKVADPVVGFRETVMETSSLKCFAETTNKRNRLTFVAERLDEGLAEVLEAGKVNLNWDVKKMGRFFQNKYDWDLLSSRSIWAFGPSSTHGTNVLLDDTLPSEVDKNLLQSCRSSIVQGFQWATREGPLCEELVRSTKIKILDVVLADKPIHRGGGQMIPTARKVVHSAILTATPRLMEPIYQLQIQCPGDMVDSIQPLLTRRRGHIIQDRPISGSLLYNVKGFLPVLDSFGFETDLRTFTQGQAMVHSVFDHWAIVPGDPLDRSIILHPLEPSPPHFLARELLVKTRRRKGLSEDVSISKFFDEGMKAQLAQDSHHIDIQSRGAAMFPVQQ